MVSSQDGYEERPLAAVGIAGAIAAGTFAAFRFGLARAVVGVSWTDSTTWWGVGFVVALGGASCYAGARWGWGRPRTLAVALAAPLAVMTLECLQPVNTLSNLAMLYVLVGILLAGGWSAAWFGARAGRRARRIESRQCVNCGYSLVGLLPETAEAQAGTVCPECGAEFPKRVAAEGGIP